MDNIILPRQPRQGKRPVPVTWHSAPVDIQTMGYRGMLVIQLPFKREWSAHRRTQVAQAVANAALHELQTQEDV